MSDYLARLVQRAGIDGPTPALQPFVRSRSPIAEHDQRLLMPAFDDAEPGMAPAIDDGSDAGSQEISSTPESGAVTVQRKAAGPPAATRPASHAISHGPAVARTDRSARPVVFDTPASGSGADELAPGPVIDRTPLRPAEPITGRPTHAARSTTQKASARPDTPLSLALPSWQSGADDVVEGLTPSTAALAMAEPAGLEVFHSESNGANTDLREIQPLEPVIRPRIEATAAVADSGSADPPQVVIGRINVEVIPPQTVQQSAPTASKPMTAAAASVIGPLGSSLSSSLRLSLRHR